jgi:hypothetical protein
MPAVEHVVLGLAPRGEAADAAELAERPEPLEAAGQELVRVGLVAVSQTIRSRGDSSSRCRAIVSSTTPRLLPRWPPSSRRCDDRLADLGGEPVESRR